MKFGFMSYSGTKAAVRKIIVVFLLLAGLFCWLFSPVTFAQESLQIDRIILTWTADPATTQTVTWIMPGNLPAHVQYIEAEKFNGDFGIAKQVDVEGAPFDSVHYRYTVTLTGLSTDTQYVYRVGREPGATPSLFLLPPLIRKIFLSCI